jgi:UDP-N-acetylglucosamine 2-epimerase
MPEEINRVLTDTISDFLFVTEAAGVENLLREGKPDEAVFLVGNVMIDSLLAQAGPNERHVLRRLASPRWPGRQSLQGAHAVRAHPERPYRQAAVPLQPVRLARLAAAAGVR